MNRSSQYLCANAKLSIAIVLIIMASSDIRFSTASYAGTAIYKHVDEDGHVTFTNRPIKGSQQFKESTRGAGPSTDSSGVSRRFPKETIRLQKKRHNKRREVLEYELATQMKLFAETRKKLSSVRRQPENLQQKKQKRYLQNKLLRHENNIAALKKELAKL